VVVLLAVMIMSCLAMMKARQIVGDGGLSLLSYQTKQRINITASLMTESLSTYQYFNEGALQIAVEFVRDRIVGYPYDGYEDDRHVPFLDSDTNTNIYPLKGFPVPLDWQVDFNINEENRQEHLQGRWNWAFDQNGTITQAQRDLYNSSSLSGSFFFQGTCDPAAGPESPFYAPNCTDANNNIDVGGVVSPNNTTRYLHEKSAELQILLKALHESHDAAFSIVIHFFNSGAGATLQYPGMVFDRNFSYVSSGCDWMRNTNPFTGGPYGTEEQIRQCHPDGAVVPGHEYNPWEEEWLAEAAQFPQFMDWVSVNQTLAHYNGRASVAPVTRAVMDQK
jgi:hypothetical protein